MASYLTTEDLDVADRRILVRTDLNVPLEEGTVSDDYRIIKALSAVERLRNQGAIVVVASHLGRPKGVNPDLSMQPVAERMSQLGGFEVRHLDAVVGPSVKQAVAEAKPGDVVMLENTRFEPGETENDPELAAALATLADYFVEDAFGSVHRAHASTVGVAELVRSAAGPLLHRELTEMGKLSDPNHPYVVVLGGAKVSDKLGVIKSLLPTVDTMLVGGGMCFTLMKAQGLEVGNSMVQDDMLDQVAKLVDGPYGARIVLPTDVVVAPEFAESAPPRVVSAQEMPPDQMGLDIGPDTAAAFAAILDDAECVFWNGPMGVFEWENFRQGTAKVAEGMAEANGFTVVGGGDSVAAIRMLDREDDISHVSTGGGAGLELLEGKKLPGIAVLEKWKDD
ncbi:MAG: phosphoglycerate kinase [Acidimicrobiia bacterium]|nr:phosphoglycerate kinase [Acidimicrobiia bacterium]